MTARTVLVLMAVVCFVLAALPLSTITVRFEWVGAALLTASLLT